MISLIIWNFQIKDKLVLKISFSSWSKTHQWIWISMVCEKGWILKNGWLENYWSPQKDQRFHQYMTRNTFVLFDERFVNWVDLNTLFFTHQHRRSTKTLRLHYGLEGMKYIIQVYEGEINGHGEKEGLPNEY